MTYHNGPRIVTNGLVLHLDAGNSKSYPGSGTVWSDLSGNGNHGTLTNGPTYNSANKGSILFDGTNDYVNCGKPPLLDIDTNSFSICMFIRPLVTNVIQVLGSKGTNSSDSGWWLGLDNRYNSNQNGITMVVSSQSSNGAFGGKSSTRSYQSNTWNYLVAIWDQTANDILLYINGSASNTSLSQNGGSGLAGVTNITNTNYNTIIMAYNIGASFNTNANLATVQIYNRALSANEVSQNYNALKGRYNL